MSLTKPWSLRALVQTSCVVATITSLCLAVAPEKDQQSVADSLTPNVGNVVTASAIIGQTVQDKTGSEIGKVVDVFIDPYFARIVSLVVTPKQELERTGPLLIPIELVTETKRVVKTTISAGEMGKDATSLTENALKSYTRRLSVATYAHYNIEPYWKDRDTKEPVKTLADRDDPFFMLSQLKSMPVKSPAGKPLGVIVDIVFLRESGEIRYTLFAQDHDDDAKERKEERRFAIPLAAFVVSPKTNNWTIELPGNLLDNTKTVSNKLPKEVSRGWVEYIHVRYGGGVFGGVQRHMK